MPVIPNCFFGSCAQLVFSAPSDAFQRMLPSVAFHAVSVPAFVAVTKTPPFASRM